MLQCMQYNIGTKPNTSIMCVGRFFKPVCSWGSESELIMWIKADLLGGKSWAITTGDNEKKI